MRISHGRISGEKLINEHVCPSQSLTHSLNHSVNHSRVAVALCWKHTLQLFGCSSLHLIIACLIVCFLFFLSVCPFPYLSITSLVESLSLFPLTPTFYLLVCHVTLLHFFSEGKIQIKILHLFFKLCRFIFIVWLVPIRVSEWYFCMSKKSCPFPNNESWTSSNCELLICILS